MKTYVISLGGSIIVPDKVNFVFLDKFVKLIKKFRKKYKFVVVTGGGGTARKYISSLKKEKLGEDVYSLIGIATTKLNARLVAEFFKEIRFEEIPDSLKEVTNLLKRKGLVVCGALGFQPEMTSDGDAAEIAKYLNTDFINLTNVKGLFDKDPNKYKNAKFISKISFEDFLDITKKIKFEAGQHFVLDKVAAEIILKEKIKTIIMDGRNLKNLENFLKGKKFIGTVVY